MSPNSHQELIQAVKVKHAKYSDGSVESWPGQQWNGDRCAVEAVDVIPILMGGDHALAGHIVARQTEVDGE